MSTVPLKYLSEAKLVDLRDAVPSMLGRYRDGDFSDLAQENGWAIEAAGIRIDTGSLEALDGSVRSAEADIENSLVVYRALEGMTPALAREERVWVRLTHIECLEYSRARWLAGTDGEELKSMVLRHMFAPGLTGIRDDNALSRLWWNVHIASTADPDDPERALRLLIQRADVRMQFVERPGIASRRPLAQAVVRAMRHDPWITSSDPCFRQFMKVLNRDGGGVLFEALDDQEADQVMTRYAARAKAAMLNADQ